MYKNYKLKYWKTNSVRSNSLSLKYQRFTTSGCKNIKTRILEFLAKTEFISMLN